MPRALSHRVCNRFSFPALEAVEPRLLFALISVVSYGAIPNDHADDLGAVRAALADSQPGDTIVFPAGQYDFSDTIDLRGQRTYRGKGNAVLVGNPDKHLFHIRENDTHVDTLTLVGKPVMIDQPQGENVHGVIINNTVMKFAGTGDDSNAITFTTGLADSVISNNRFENAPHGIYGYYWNNLTIANNEFIKCEQGLHVDDHSDASRNLLIEQNYFSGIRRMAIEYQGGGFDTIVQDNWYENPALSSVFDENNESFAFSIIADRSTGTIARRNVILAPQRPDGVGVRIGFEIGGDNALVEDNYINGINHVLAANDYSGTTSVSAKNNYFANALLGPVGRNLTQSNNGDTVKLSWDLSRGRPLRNVRLEGTAPLSFTPGEQPIAPAPVAPSSVAGFVYASDLKWTSSKNGWGPVEKNRANGGRAANDGAPLTIAGKTYTRGLGVAVKSEITYALDGDYARFFSDIGVDDRVRDSGSVTFEIWVDNRKVFDSGTIRGSDARRTASVNLLGAKTLKLVTTDAGDGSQNDHADWGAARLTKA